MDSQHRKPLKTRIARIAQPEQDQQEQDQPEQDQPEQDQPEQDQPEHHNHNIRDDTRRTWLELNHHKKQDNLDRTAVIGEEYQGGQKRIALAVSEQDLQGRTAHMGPLEHDNQV